MIIQLTIEFDMAEYQEPDTLSAAEQLAKALIRGEADWPDMVRIDCCKGQTSALEFKP